MTFNIYGRHGIMEMIDFPALKTQLGYGKSVTLVGVEFALFK
jgi:hypothetical protein